MRRKRRRIRLAVCVASSEAASQEAIVLTFVISSSSLDRCDVRYLDMTTLPTLVTLNVLIVT